MDTIDKQMKTDHHHKDHKGGVSSPKKSAISTASNPTKEKKNRVTFSSRFQQYSMNRNDSKSPDSSQNNKTVPSPQQNKNTKTQTLFFTSKPVISPQA